MPDESSATTVAFSHCVWRGWPATHCAAAPALSGLKVDESIDLRQPVSNVRREPILDDGFLGRHSIYEDCAHFGLHGAVILRGSLAQFLFDPVIEATHGDCRHRRLLCCQCSQ